MMDRDFENGKTVATRVCSNADCGIEYGVGAGGQKGEASPVVWVPSPRDPALGFCSLRCKTFHTGGNVEQLENVYEAFFGTKLPESGQLAPARKVRGGD